MIWLQPEDLLPKMPEDKKKVTKIHFVVMRAILYKQIKTQTQFSQRCHWFSSPWKRLFSFNFLPATAWHRRLSTGNVFEVQLLGQDFCCGKDICSNSHHPSSSEVFLSPWTSPREFVLFLSQHVHLAMNFSSDWGSFLAKISEISECPYSMLDGVQNLWCFFC